MVVQTLSCEAFHFSFTIPAPGRISRLLLLSLGEDVLVVEQHQGNNAA